jgi:hypothetical protein
MLVSICPEIHAQHYNTVASNRWEISNCWDAAGCAPKTGHNIVSNINSGNDITETGNISYSNGCEINISGNLTINGNVVAKNNLPFNVSGTLILNGDLDANNNASIFLNQSGNTTVNGDIILGNNSDLCIEGTLSCNNIIAGSGHLSCCGVLYVKGSITGLDISGFCGSINPSPLPVGLINFAAACKDKDGTVQITWSTATETNNDHFTVECSKDCKNWSTILTVNGAGNSNQLLTYSGADHSPVFSDKIKTLYYRLKQTDYNGNSKTFKIVSVDQCNDQNAVDVLPDPFKDFINVNYSSPDAQNIHISIVDMAGNIHYSSIVEAKEGLNSYTIFPAGLAPSIYYISITGDSKTTTKKIIKL